ncbi:hypothetical protein VP01_9631g1, partial [Puccinia sorghi]
DRLLTGECTKVQRLKIIPQLGKPLASPGGGYKIITKARCLLTHFKLSRSFWAEAVKTALQLSDLTPLSTRNMQIPYQTWTG